MGDDDEMVRSRCAASKQASGLLRADRWAPFPNIGSELGVSRHLHVADLTMDVAIEWDALCESRGADAVS